MECTGRGAMMLAGMRSAPETFPPIARIGATSSVAPSDAFSGGVARHLGRPSETRVVGTACGARRERYIGIYVHGRKDRIKRGGKRIAQVADPAHVMRVPVAEWRIIDEATWEAVQAELPKRGPRTYQVGRGAKHALAGIGKCDHCGGGISTRNTKTSRGRVTAYACGWHHKRGQAVCPVTICQPVDEVEGALVGYMCATVLTEEIVERIVADVTAEIERAVAAPSESTALGSGARPAPLRAEEVRGCPGRRARRQGAGRRAAAPIRPHQADRGRPGGGRTPPADAPRAARSSANLRPPEAGLPSPGARHRPRRDAGGVPGPLPTRFAPLPPDRGRWPQGLGDPRDGAPRGRCTFACDPTGNRTRDCAVRGRRPNR